MKNVERIAERVVRAVLPVEKAPEEGFLRERWFTHEEDLTVGIVSMHSKVPDIGRNKQTMVQSVRTLKAKGCQLILFPEFSLTGYFWDDEDCWEYMDRGVVEENQDLFGDLEGMLDDTLKMVVFNNIRKGEGRKYLNSTFVVNGKFDYLDPKYIYDKIFLPGIEKRFTVSGEDDRLVVETPWGRLGFTTCYDFCFNSLMHEYAFVDEVDALVQLASWRAVANREYPMIGAGTSTYYGDLWDWYMPATASRNQVTILACNAVGKHEVSGAVFHGGGGVWAPSGMPLVQASNVNEEMVVVHGLDVKGAKGEEEEDFDYGFDYSEIYREIKGKRTFTRI